jgi:uncharacterized protein (DUF1501 family)
MKNHKSELSRRHFLRMGTRVAASSGLLATMGGFDRVLAATPYTRGYKALVCVWLAGGNQSFNWMVPYTQAGYNVYAKSRAAMALPRSSLLPLTGTASDGYAYAMHPNCPELQGLFNGGQAAILGNVATLIQPTTAAQARAGSVPLPPQLFSHIDQTTEWMTSIPNSEQRYGWAGRVADFYKANGYNANLAMNINVGGTNYLQEGQTTIPYVLGTDGAPSYNEIGNTGYRNGTRAAAAQALYDQATSDPNLLVSQYAAIQNNAASKVSLVDNAIGAVGDLSTAFPSFAGDWNLGQQLHEVALCIKAHSQIGDSRQIFFVQLGGFDTHDGELSNQASQLAILSQNLGAFWAALGEIGMQHNVTVFTASDFGRTISSNNDGSDHGWGGHHMIIGGAVKGGLYYGTMPDLTVGGPDDFGGGQIVPTTSTDQYAATLAHWFGIASADLGTLFPNLANFSTPTLGFFNAPSGTGTFHLRRAEPS